MTTTDTNDMTRSELSGRVDTLGWGLLFLAIGGIGLAPDMPEGAWLIAAGVVMVGISAARAYLGLPVRSVTVIVGIVALAAGIGSVAGLATATGPFVLIVLGLTLVVGSLYRTGRSTRVASPSEGG